ncbi:MAG: hypothetical protein KDD53_03645, partial [Bdellovibrionales bacterium]|nr:hypothetical protein [Bdellovibrionales bacterium]
IKSITRLYTFAFEVVLTTAIGQVLGTNTKLTKRFHNLLAFSLIHVIYDAPQSSTRTSLESDLLVCYPVSASRG